MAIHGKILIILLLLITLSACSVTAQTEAPPAAQPSVASNSSDEGNADHESAPGTPDLQTECIRIYDVGDFIDTDDPTPTLEIRDPEQIASIIHSVDFSKWKKVSLQEEYSAEPCLCVVFNDHVTIVMDNTIPEGYGYLCKGIRSDKENENYRIEDSEGLCIFNDMFWETIQSCLTP